MNNIYMFQAGVELIDEAIDASIYRNIISNINPYLDSKALRIFRKVHFSLKLQSKSKWVDHIVNEYSVKNSPESTIIVFDSPIWMENIAYLRKKYNKAKIIFWYWNIIKNVNLLCDVLESCDAVFTFDYKDSREYNLKYHPQFYWLKENNANEIVYDVLFVGKNKKRIDLLEKIYLELKRKKLTPYFYIVRDGLKDSSEYIELQDHPLPYSKVLELISKSKSILDINQGNQMGLTLRALEALFLRKKLISNNKSLPSYDFYNSCNIKVISEDFTVDSDFLNGPFVSIDNSIIEKYTFDHWVEFLTKAVT